MNNNKTKTKVKTDENNNKTKTKELEYLKSFKKCFKYFNKSLKNKSSAISSDNKGNFSIIISVILLISFLILSIAVLNTVLEENKIKQESISSSQYKYIITDYERNIGLIEREALEELSNEVIKNKIPTINSREELKKKIDVKLKKQNQKYYEIYNIQINSSLSSIENTTDPFYYKFKTYISTVKDNLTYQNIVESNVNCLNLKDPIPLLYCGPNSGVKNSDITYNNYVYNYGNSLSQFLKNKNIENYSAYINASSPIIIRKCPYDPYKHHGDDNGKIMKNCRENGYYHESADGACYLCRLEGKCGCNHYGFETFINPQKTNKTDLISVCSSDHVIFSNNPYPGVEVIYDKIYENNDELNQILFLDPHGHKVKYGMGNY